MKNTGTDPGSPEAYFLADPQGIAWWEVPRGPQPEASYTLWDQDPRSCKAPSLDLNSFAIQVQPGQAETANICFTIGSQDASTSMLAAVGGERPDYVSQWFMLH